jgi:hypothetical protein
MTEGQVIAKYGPPGLSNIVLVDIPYPMVLAWDKTKTVNRVRCHKLIVPNLLGVLNDLLATYGVKEIKKLGIDLFGGLYEYRLIRGGSKLSRHSWGIAIDLDPARNGNLTKFKNAAFSKPAYKSMIDIFYKHNFISYGIELGRDAMHFEIKS